MAGKPVREIGRPEAAAPGDDDRPGRTGAGLPIESEPADARGPSSSEPAVPRGPSKSEPVVPRGASKSGPAGPQPPNRSEPAPADLANKSEPAEAGAPIGPEPAGTLRLVQEAAVRDLLPDGVGARLEASGVLAADGLLYLIFDNLASIAVLDPVLDPDRSGSNVMIERHGDPGAEDIARDPLTGHYYVLYEARPRGDGFQAWVEELDPRFRHVAGHWLEFPLPCANKGLEGLTCLRRDGETYLLGLCEGNRCRGGAAGRRPGGGRLQVFRRDGAGWRHVRKLHLPETAWFVDYSSVSVRGDRIAVISQESSALWVGRLPSSGWELDDPGRVYLFPRDRDGRILYCTVEGVSWLSDGRVTVVSDRAKASQRARCRRKEQSVHIFDLPTTGTGPGTGLAAAEPARRRARGRDTDTDAEESFRTGPGWRR